MMHLPVPSPSADFVRMPSPEPRIFFSGRLDREKGVRELLLAFAQVAAANPLVTLRIAGRGPERERLENLVRELGLERRVNFLGWLEPIEIERELSVAWALAAPSLWAEPLGLVALEAIVRRVPVVASAVGGFAEIVEEGVDGMLVPRGDVDALADRLLSIAERRSFVDGVPEEVAQRVADNHGVARHVGLLRAMFADVATQINTSVPAQTSISSRPSS
jgi:glycosyltransferase involved in cell wall biosynthesis